MENLKSFLYELQERYRNPLISSFIISWLFCNWKITLLLIHFTTDSQSNLKYDEVIVKIIGIANMYNSFVFPASAALFYVLIFPKIRNRLSYLQALYNKEKNELELKGSKDGSISVNKYLSLRDEYVQKIEELKRIIDSEDSLRRELFNIKSQLFESQNSLREERDRQYKLNSKYQFYELHGFWKFKINSNPPIEKINFNGRYIDFNVDVIQIEGHLMKLYSKNKPEIIYSGYIKYFEQDKEDNNSSFRDSIFIFVEINQNKGEDLIETLKFSLVFKLKQSKNYSFLEGTLNDIYKVKLEIDKKD